MMLDLEVKMVGFPVPRRKQHERIKAKAFSCADAHSSDDCLAFGANAWKSSLKINQIKIDGNRIVGMNEIIQLTQVQIGALLYQVNLTSIQQNVMSHYYIKDAVVERNLPNSIHIQISERVPVAMVNLSEPLYLDEDGVVLPKLFHTRFMICP